ncbi:hypothetical protein Tsubulata_009510, partial [Turnera subulata]
MACFDRASPALYEILLKLYRAEKPVEIDHHLHEFGSVEYHVQSSAADPHHNYLSISTPLLFPGMLNSDGLSPFTIKMIKELCSDAVEIVEPANEGYLLTLKLNLAKIPNGKGSEKIIRQIASVQAVILSSQLKEMLQSVNSQGASQWMYKPIKLVYHPREPFYVIRQALHKEDIEEAKEVKSVKGCWNVGKLVSFPKSKNLKKKCGNFAKKIKRIRFRI